MLQDVLYDRRELTRLLCMRVTLHVVPSGEIALFFQAYAEHRTPTELCSGEALLVRAGLCQQEEAVSELTALHRQVLDVLAERGPSTVRTIIQAVPKLKTKVKHSVGKSYEGEFSIGSRLIPGMCALGLLVRARPRGSWRSNLYEYAALSEWLPNVNLDAVCPRVARSWLTRRYLSAFGPATFADVQWWTGFSSHETKAALQELESEMTEVTVEGLGEEHLMLISDVQQLREFVQPDAPYVFLLPGLDPYIMGYHNRDRFLAPEHHKKVFDRAGNAMPTVWVNSRVVGAWGQREDGSVVYRVFEHVDEEEQALLAKEAQRLESFLGNEFLRPRSHTPFTRPLLRQ
jgi:hypothetical protein